MSDYQMTMTDEFTSTLAANPSNYSPDQIKQMAYDLDVIAKENERLRLDVGALRKHLNEGQACIENAKIIILEAFDCDDFDKDVVTAIAEALEIELTQEHSVTINVTFSGTVTVPLGFDMDDLENHIDFEASANSYTDFECDLFTDGVDVNVN